MTGRKADDEKGICEDGRKTFRPFGTHPLASEGFKVLHTRQRHCERSGAKTASLKSALLIHYPQRSLAAKFIYRSYLIILIPIA